MCNSMTPRERFARMFAHEQADRVPIIDEPWPSTIERWNREGLPAGVDFREFFDLDFVAHFEVDNSPRYPVEILEETDRYTIHRTSWGATLKDWRHAGGVPEFLDFTVTDAQKWYAAKARMQPTKDRIPWNYLRDNYSAWKSRGYWIEAGLWFGFDVSHSWIVGTERLLMAMLEEPEWLIDMFNHQLDLSLALLQQVWDEGFHFDAVKWPDDMGFKHNQFFSLRTYRLVLKPIHERAISWAHQHGIKAHLHSCGDINPMVPELVQMGLDALNPLEVKAGMDPLYLKQKFGDALVLHGGLNAVLWDDREAVEAEMHRLVPRMKENSGYIFSSDHSVPDTVSFANFCAIIHLAKELGTY